MLDSLRESEEFLRKVLASTDDCIKVLDLDAHLTFMSENGRRALAIPDFDLVRGADWLTFWHGDDRVAAEAAVAAALAGGKGEFEGFFETMAGEPKWFHVVVSPMLGSDGTPERLLAVSRDVTRARRDREVIERSAAEYRALAERLAVLYEREHHVAGALQEAALPRSLPAVPGVHFDAVYVSGKSEAEVGGDWYDAFVLPDGRVLISIGDVVGSGLYAAVTMTKIREAIRTAALADPDPVAILALADLALSLDDPDKMATALVAVLDPLAGTLTCAAAGHPGPLLHAPGRAIADPFVERALPLGMRAGELGTAQTVALEPGTFLTFFTDGLVEASRDALEGERRLYAAIADPAVRSAARPAGAIRTAVLGDQRRDDVAILTVGLISA